MPRRVDARSVRSVRRSFVASDLRALTESAVNTLTALPFQAWHFGDSIAFEAGVAADDRLGRRDAAEFLRGFARGWAARKDQFVEMDATAPGLALVHLADAADDTLLRTAAAELAEYLTRRPTLGGAYQTWASSPLRQPYGEAALTPEDERLLGDPGPGVFIDCLHFDPPFFAALYRSTGEDRWAEHALTQAVAYVTLLQDENTGLFWHFYLKNSGRQHMLGWGRGQGWALLGLLDVIDELGLESAAALIAPVQRLITAMQERQQPDGSWYAVAGVPESGAETSTAAFMAHGFRRAIDLGVVAANGALDDAIARAQKVTISNTNEDGVLVGVSVAVWASTVDTHYHHVPTGPVTAWGQGPLVLTLLDALSAAPG